MSIQTIQEKNPNAKKLERVTYKDLTFLTSVENSAPGQYQIMDAMGLNILERSKLPAVIFEGTKDNILAILQGANIGTWVGPNP